MKKILLLTILLGVLMLSPVVSAGLGDENDNRVIISVKYSREGPFGGSTIESPIEGARVEIKEGIETIAVGETDQYGIYELYLENGDYTIGVTASGFEPYTYEILGLADEDLSVPIILTMTTPVLFYVSIFLVSVVVVGILIFKYKDGKRKKGKKESMK
jgi:hypothetical protein